jgi:cytochrome c oxidase subunit 4
MQQAGHAQSGDQIKRSRRHEGPRNHLIAFAISIILTILAFAAVSIPGLSKGFVFTLLVLMAILQVLVQLAFWMHLKDRGHFWAILTMIFGALVVVYAVASAELWTWFA